MDVLILFLLPDNMFQYLLYFALLAGEKSCKYIINGTCHVYLTYNLVFENKSFSRKRKVKWLKISRSRRKIIRNVSGWIWQLRTKRKNLAFWTKRVKIFFRWSSWQGLLEKIIQSTNTISIYKVQKMETQNFAGN